MANKALVMTGAVIGMTVGAVVPTLWGDSSLFGFTSIFISTVGGIFGIWLVVWLDKRFS